MPCWKSSRSRCSLPFASTLRAVAQFHIKLVKMQFLAMDSLWCPRIMLRKCPVFFPAVHTWPGDEKSTDFMCNETWLSSTVRSELERAASSIRYASTGQRHSAGITMLR
jgi:hypothetical protein